MGSYSVEGLWQRGINLGIISAANSSVKSSQSLESWPDDDASAFKPLSEVSRGHAPLLAEQQSRKTQRTKALTDLNRLLRLVTEQEKKYGCRLSVHGNFYQRHIIVQQFIQSQITTGERQREELSLNVARSFGLNKPTARNIVQWENIWVDLQEIPERKEKEDYDSWIHDPDLNDAIRAFVRTQGDCKYCLN